MNEKVNFSGSFEIILKISRKNFKKPIKSCKFETIICKIGTIICKSA